MICNACGRNIKNEEANFCEYCGASFRGRGEFETKPSPMPIPEAVAINHREKPVSFLDWLGTYLIMFIPLIGSIVFIVMLIIWSLGRNVSESKKNWARASLVFMLIMFFMLIFIFSVLGPEQLINNMLNDMNQFNNMF